MKDNKIALILKGFGVFVAAGCLIAAIMVSIGTSNEALPLLIFAAGLISCLVFVGFGEIINILQKSLDKQDEIQNRLAEICSNLKSSD